MEKASVTEAVANVINSIQIPNILVIGGTGSGKSTLINAVFGTESAKVGAGLPVTQGFSFYSNGLVNIYDSAGYEAGENTIFVNDIFEFLRDKQIEGIEKQIHIVWYVINASSSRVQLFDIDIIDQCRKYGLPVIIVISQVDRAKEKELNAIKNALLEFDLTNSDNIVEVSAAPLIIRGKPICEPFGLDKLVNKTIKQLPEIYADAVRIAQVVDLKSKRELVWKLIAAAALANFGSAFIPIPGLSTGASLVAQISLPISIASVYGLEDAREFLKKSYREVSAEALMGFAGATLGLDIVRSVFPIIGSTIAGGTAATVIVITGLAYASIFEAMVKANINPKDSVAVHKFFSDNFQNQLKKYSDVVIKTTKDLAKVKNRFLDQ